MTPGWSESRSDTNMLFVVSTKDHRSMHHGLRYFANLQFQKLDMLWFIRLESIPVMEDS